MQCPRCGATALAGAVFCESDGTRLVPIAAPSAAQPTGTVLLTCPCGAATDDGDGYCSRCGHRLVPAVPAGQTAPSPLRAPDRSELAPTCDLGATTDRGRHHPRNEDAVAVASVGSPDRPAYVLVVCDGVSTSSDGARAAQIGVRCTCDALERIARATAEQEQTTVPVTPEVGGASAAEPATRAMADAIRQAHGAICSQVQAQPGDPTPAGTTIVAALATAESVTLGWVGDSRAYWVSPDGAGLLTSDHSWLNEVVARGEMSEAEALRAPQAHALTHCLGPLEQEEGDPPPEPSVGTFTPPPQTRLILCSDGLWNHAPRPADVAQLVRAVPAGGGAQLVARHLVDYALAQGGQDNVTVAVALLP